MIIEELRTPIVCTQLEQHDELKDIILSQIAESQHGTLRDEFDDIEKLDWGNASDMTRPWVQTLFPNLSKSIGELMFELGFMDSRVYNVWFQQYEQKGIHGWHIHGHNYVGVYYLELPDDAPPTELLNPIGFEKKRLHSIKEGDVILFPSYVIHEAPLIENPTRKTIVSFNVDALAIRADIV